MSEWLECTLGEAPIEIIDGDRGKNYPKTTEFSNTGYCLFLSAKNVTATGFTFSESNFIDQSRDKLLRQGKMKRGDLVLTTRGTVGNVAYYHNNIPFDHIRINSGMVIIRPDGIDEKFNYQLFKFLSSSFQVFATGSAQPQLPIRDLKEIPITLPPLPEQQAIAAVLSSLDDKIDLLHRQNKTLEALAQTLFRHWFVDGAQDFVKLTEMVEINPTLSLRKGTLAPYLEMKNVQSDSCAPSDWYDRELNSGTRFQNGDTLMARITPCLENNKVAHVSFLDDGQVGWGSTEFLVLRAKGNLPKFYTYLLAKDSDFRAFAINSMTGSSGRQRVQTDSLYEYELGYPTENNLASFAEQIDPIEQKLQVNSKQIRTLEKLRDTLLPKLMSGEVRVRL